MPDSNLCVEKLNIFGASRYQYFPLKNLSPHKETFKTHRIFLDEGKYSYIYFHLNFVKKLEIASKILLSDKDEDRFMEKISKLREIKE